MKKFFSAMLAILIMLNISIISFAADEEENTYTNTGNLKNDIIGHAETQIGYTSDVSGSKYDSITSNDTDNWSTSFLIWCAHAALVSQEAIPNTPYVAELYDFYSDNDILTTDDTYTPVAGDIIFITENKEISLCGIVTYSDEKYVTAIIGDDDNSVKKKMYDLSLEKIAGYATPDYTLRAPVITGNYITTANPLNFRSKPTTESEILGKIPLGTVVNITSIENGWGSINYDGKDGYISMDYASEYDTTHRDVSKYAVNWNVIDISKFQGDIDWNELALADIDGIIVRIGFRGTNTKVLYTDDKFFEFYTNAKEKGYHVGCYFYSGATTVAEAEEEANYVTDIIRQNDLKFDMPVYWDVEDTVIRDTGRENICNMTKAFLKIMKNENIYSGVYTSSTWMFDYFDPSIFSGHALWIADWRGNCAYMGDYGMWQYTDEGEVNGITGKTDKNYCYINYPLLINDQGYNKTPDTISPIDKGDINADGKITAADARAVLRAAAQLTTLTDEEKTAADMDDSNTISASDARKILRISAKLE